MAEIRAFRGYLYNPEKVEHIELALAPPYDVISPRQQLDYMNRHEHNILKVDYRPDEDGVDKYAAAAEVFEKWIEDKIIVRDAKPAIYVLEQYFIDWEGFRRLRRGFIALIKLEEFGKGSIYPHEKTFPKHKQDRLRLFRATGAQFNPVFSIFPDQDGNIAPVLKNIVDNNLPDMNFRFHDGVTNSMWRLTDEKSIELIQDAMSRQPVFIADGHHRYETSLNLYREMAEREGGAAPESSYKYTLMYFVSMEDEGLTVLSAHRMLKNLPDFSEKKALELLSANFVCRKMNRSEAIESLSIAGQAHVMAMQIANRFYVLRPREEAINNSESLLGLHESLRDLEVSICQELAVRPLIGDADPLDHLGYEVDPIKVAHNVEKGDYQAAFYLPPTPIRQMTRVARALQVMPHKSTYFYPKLLTGLVMRRF